MYSGILTGTLFLIFFENLWKKMGIVFCYYLYRINSPPSFLPSAYLFFGLASIGFLLRWSHLVSNLKRWMLVLGIIFLLIIPDWKIMLIFSNTFPIISKAVIDSILYGVLAIICCILCYMRKDATFYKNVLVVALFLCLFSRMLDTCTILFSYSDLLWARSVSYIIMLVTSCFIFTRFAGVVSNLKTWVLSIIIIGLILLSYLLQIVVVTREIPIVEPLLAKGGFIIWILTLCFVKSRSQTWKLED